MPPEFIENSNKFYWGYMDFVNGDWEREGDK